MHLKVEKVLTNEDFREQGLVVLLGIPFVVFPLDLTDNSFRSLKMHILHSNPSDVPSELPLECKHPNCSSAHISLV